MTFKHRAGTCGFKEGRPSFEVWATRKAEILPFQAIHGRKFEKRVNKSILEFFDMR